MENDSNTENRNDREKPFDFWNDHSVEFLEMALKRDYQERVSKSDGFGTKKRSCGDTVEFYLMVDNGNVSAVSYDVQGCLYSHACVNSLIHLVIGKTIAEARQLEPLDIISFLKTLPAAEEHCADHAVATFRLAIEDYESARR